MPRKKCIVKCETPSDIMFTIPTRDHGFSLWKKACDGNVKLTRGMYICANHFSKDDIIKRQFLFSKGNIIIKELEKPRLKPGVVPSIFYKTKDQISNETEHDLSTLNNSDIAETSMQNPHFTDAGPKTSIESVCENHNLQSPCTVNSKQWSNRKSKQKIANLNIILEDYKEKLKNLNKVIVLQ